MSTDLDQIDLHNIHRSLPIAHKIYIGGLPELTRLEDLQDCFSQLGHIKNIELKNGYGFVEYDSTQAASDAVSKYHEGTFLGAQIRVEISHGGSRPRHVAVANNPDACYTCGIAGHWARDCPDAQSSPYSRRRLRPRSRSPPPRLRDHPHTRPPRAEYEPPPRHHYRRRTPPLESPYARPDRDRVHVARSGYLPELVDDKRYRPDHLRDARAPFDSAGLSRGRSREPYGFSPALGPPPLGGPRDYYPDYRGEYGYRFGPPEPYPPHALPPGPDMYDERVPGYLVKAYHSSPAYHREPFDGRPAQPLSGGRYLDRGAYEARPRYIDHRPSVIHTDRRDDQVGGPIRRGPIHRSSPGSGKDRSPRRGSGGGIGGATRRSVSPHAMRSRGVGPASGHRNHSHRHHRDDVDDENGHRGNIGGQDHVRGRGSGRDDNGGGGGYSRGGQVGGGMRR